MGIGNFMPNFMNYTGQGAFRYWCQTVLPLVYDDSLSYYELLNKVVVYLNNCIKDVSTAEANLEELRLAFGDLNRDVSTKYTALETAYNENTIAFNNLTAEYNTFLTWFNDPNNYQTQIDSTVTAVLDEMVTDGTLPNMVANIINTSETIHQVIADWLADYAETSGISAPAVDPTLKISSAAADAKVTGASIYGLSNEYYPMKYVNYQKRAIVNGSIQSESASTGNRLIIRYDFRNVERAIISCSSTDYIIRVIWYFTPYQTTGGTQYEIVSGSTDPTNNKFIIPKVDGKTDVWIVLTKADPTAIFADEEMATAVATITVNGYYADKYFDIITSNFKGESVHPSEITRGDLNYPGNSLTRTGITHFACSPSIYRSSTDYPMYVIRMNDDNFYMKDIVRYPTAEVGTTRERLKSISDTKYENKFIILTDANYPYYRITFGKKNVADDYALTDEDMLAINEGIDLARLVDITLTQQGTPADAYTTGLKFDETKEMIDENYDAFTDAIFGLYNTRINLSYTFHRGYITPSTGGQNPSETEEYRAYYASVFSNRVVQFTEGNFKYRLFYYIGTPTINTYNNYYTDYVDCTTKSYISSAHGDRAIVQIMSETALTDDDLATILENFEVKYYKEIEPEVAPEQVISTRPNKGIVNQVVDVCYNWYNNRQEADLRYGYNGILNTSDPTSLIDCSTFVGLVLRGYNYTDTSYYSHDYVSPSVWKGNPAYDWSIPLRDYKEYNYIDSTSKTRVRSTSQLAQWLVNNGRRVLIDDYLTNIEVGDLIFFSRIDEDTGDYVSPRYYMKINHVAIVVSKERMTSSSDWDATTYPWKHMIMDVGHENGYWYDTNKKVLRPYPLDLRPLEAPQHLTNTELTEADENSIYTNNINTMVLVCRPDFGALSVPTT